MIPNTLLFRTALSGIFMGISPTCQKGVTARGEACILAKNLTKVYLDEEVLCLAPPSLPPSLTPLGP